MQMFEDDNDELKDAYDTTFNAEEQKSADALAAYLERRVKIDVEQEEADRERCRRLCDPNRVAARSSTATPQGQMSPPASFDRPNAASTGKSLDPQCAALKPLSFVFAKRRTLGSESSVDTLSFRPAHARAALSGQLGLVSGGTGGMIRSP